MKTGNAEEVLEAMAKGEVAVAPGIYKRTSKKGDKFRVKIRESGVPLTKTFNNFKDAKAWQASKRNAINTGAPTNHESIKKLTLAEIFTEYKTHNELKYDKKGRINRLIVEIGKVPFANFKTMMFSTYIKAKLNQEIPNQKKTEVVHPLFKNYKKKDEDGKLVARKYSPSSVRKYYYDIRMALEWHAKMNDYHFDSKPFDDVPAPHGWEKARDRIIYENELEELLKACEKMYVNREALKCIILFQIYSCMRIGETLLMKWKHVHLNHDKPQESYIFVPKENQKIKNKRNAQDRHVLVRPELYELFKVIEALPKTKNAKKLDRVFPQWSSSGTFGSRFKVICKNANSEELTPHDMRHTGLSWYFENTNLTDIEISNHSGHIELETLKRYAKLRPSKTGEKLWQSLGAL